MKELITRPMGTVLIIGALAVLLCIPPAEALFAPKADLWERWTAHSPSSTASIDHSEWDAFLARHLVANADGVNRIGYGKVSDTDKARLESYLASLAALPISNYSRGEQRAYWINLYNALTVDVVLDHYPVSSIREISISPGFFSIGPWGKKLITIEGEKVSLDDIEHRILRPIWKDPRIHYAVNCAALGCPNLMPRAFTAENTERLLEQGARDFINSDRGARLESDTRLIASSIYDWFQEDFGGDEVGVIAHLRRYAGAELESRLQGIDEVYDYEYDWSLNDTHPPEHIRERRAGSTNR